MPFRSKFYKVVEAIEGSLMVKKLEAKRVEPVTFKVGG